MLYRDGLLYYEPSSEVSSAGVPLLAQPVAGGAAATLQTVPFSAIGFFAADVWLDGDNIAYTQGDQENQLYSVPIAGGDPQLLLDVGAGRTDAGEAQLHDLTSTDFVWTESSSAVFGATNVWHASRAGGAAQQIGAVGDASSSATVAAIATIGAEAFVATADGAAYAFALDGSNSGTPRTLATRDDVTQGTFAGLNDAGAFWLVWPSDGSPAQLALSPADGSAVRTFWAGLPAHASVDRIWPDGDGGWIAIGSEAFQEGSYGEAWAIDAQGHGSRLGCSPPGDVHALQARPAIAPDAVYLFLTDLSGQHREIDRIAR